MSLFRRFGILALPLLVSGCVSMKESTPIGPDAAMRGVALVRELPAHLPAQTASIPVAPGASAVRSTVPTLPGSATSDRTSPPA